MNQLDKVEFIVMGILAKKKYEYEISKDKASNFWIAGLDHEISMLERVLSEIGAVKRSGSETSVKVLLKLYPPDQSK